MMEKQPNIPKNWVTVTLGDVCQILDALRIPVNSEERNKRIVDRPASELYPYYGATGQVGVIDKYLFKGEHILLGEDGAPFLEPFRDKAYIVDGEFWVNNHAHILRSEISNRYLCYYLNQLDYSEHVTGTTRLKLTQSALKAIPIKFAPANEQKRIVAKIEELFSELDKGIESLKTAREQLKVYRQAVLKQAFEGKLTAEWRRKYRDKLPNAEQLLESIKRERDNSYQQQLDERNIAIKAGRKQVKPSVPQPIANLTPGELQKLPSLPDGWIWLRYGDLCSVVRNGISQKPEGNEGTKIFRISAVRPMEFITDDIRYIDNKNGQYDEYFLHKGDLVFTRYNGSRPFVGVCAEYKADGTHLFPDKLVQTRIAVPSMISGYLEKAVNCGASREFIERLIRTTAGQSGISGADIKSMPVPICSRAEQIIINDFLNEELSRISKMTEEIEANLQRSESLRQSILKKAFSGKLVAQDPNDEPASVLLERIRAEKESPVQQSWLPKTHVAKEESVA